MSISGDDNRISDLHLGHGVPKIAPKKNVHHKCCLRCWHLYPFLVECWISKPM